MRNATVGLILGMAAILGAVGCTKAPDDQALATEIKSRMFSDAQVKNANLNVTVKNGEATLEGEAPSDAARYEAYKVASETPGVHHVQDNMRVQQAEIVPPPATEAPAPQELVSARARRVHKRTPRAEAPIESPAESHAPATVVAQAAPAPVETAPPPPPPLQEPKPRKFIIQPGTRVLVRMIDGIDSQVARAGQLFRASVESPIAVDDQVVVPQRTDVMVRLAEASSAGRMSGRSELKVELAEMILNGRTYSLTSSSVDRTGASRGKDTAIKTGGGAVLGAIIGAIAGGGKGAAIGTIAGAGAGGAVQAATHGQQIRIPSETTLDFRLETPVTVTLPPENRSEKAR